MVALVSSEILRFMFTTVNPFGDAYKDGLINSVYSVPIVINLSRLKCYLYICPL